MSTQVRVEGIEVLDALDARLAVFADAAHEVRRAVQGEVEQTLAWLTERHTHWTREVERHDQTVQLAGQALARCQASGTRDKNGRYIPPNCSAYIRAFDAATAQLRQAQQRLSTATHWLKQVQNTYTEYTRELRPFVHALEIDIPEARGFLREESHVLKKYVQMGGYCSDNPLNIGYSSALDSTDNGQYDKHTDRVYINAEFSEVTERALIEPILRHEAVHAELRSDAPMDEASLDAYVEEELSAYRAQAESWKALRSDFLQSHNIRELSAPQEALLQRHQQNVERFESPGELEFFRQQLRATYRERMPKNS